MTTPAKTSRPMGDRGQGRKALPPDDKLKTVSVRMNDEQKATYERMGAGQWLRDLLDKLKGPQ